MPLHDTTAHYLCDTCSRQTFRVMSDMVSMTMSDPVFEIYEKGLLNGV